MKKQIKTFFKDHMITVIVSLLLIFPIVGYALTASGFTDYSPPGSLYITWWDYYSDENRNQPSANNAVTDFPSWSAEYPYRAIFLGGTPASGSQTQGHDFSLYIVYSKKQLSSAFSFQYRDITKGNNDNGYIRALFNKNSYGFDKDIMIVYIQGGELSPSIMTITRPNNYSTYTYGSHNTIGDNVYFDFDFYYDCASDHQTNAESLNISGLKSVANVPYDYIIHCDHTGGGNGSASGGSSGGGSSSGGSGGKTGNDYTVPDGGSYPDKSGQIVPVPDDWENPSSGTGNGKDRPDHQLDIPDDWENPPDTGSGSGSYPWENPANIPDDNFSITPNPDGVTIGEGTTGDNGANWTPPDVDFPIKLPFVDDDVNILPYPFEGALIQGMPEPDWGYSYSFPPSLPVAP